jgi:HEAT repeat protein
MRRSLTRLLQLRSGEGRLVTLASGFFLLIQAAQMFTVSAADTLLLGRFGVEILPRLFIALGAMTLVATLAYAAVLGRPNRTRLSLWVLIGAAAAAIAGWAVTFQSNSAVYPWLWLGVSLMNAVIGTLIWVIAGEVCDARQAKRLFAIFASAGILGSVLAGFLTGPLAERLGAPMLLPVSAVLILAGALIGRLLARDYARQAKRSTSQGRPLADLAQAHRLVASNPTMRLTSVAAVIFSILFFSVSYPFSVQVARAFPDEAQLAAFFGSFGGVVTGVTFIVSLVVAGRVYARIGVTGALLLLPLAYFAGFVLWSIRLDLMTTVLFRFGQLVLLGGIAGTAFNALFNVVPADHRAQVRAYQSGPPAQLGVILSGVLLILGQRGLTLPQTLAMGLFFSIVCAALVWRMGRTYGASLVASLRQGVTDVFTASATPFQAVRQDAESVRVALGGLNDGRPSIRRLSATLLGELGAVESIQPLASHRGDAAPEVRVAAVQALGQISSEAAAQAAADFLADPEEAVRAAAVTASRPSAAELADLAEDRSPRVRSRVAVALARSGELPSARAILQGLLAGPDVEGRVAGLEACAEVEGAASRLGGRPSPELDRTLLAALDDVEPEIRRAAGRSLRRIGEVEALIPVLNHGSDGAQDEVVTILAGRSGAARQAVLDWTARRMAEAEQLHAWVAALSGLAASPALRGLHASLSLAEEKVEQRALRGLASAESGDAMRSVARGLRSRDREVRSQSVEALESVGDRRLSRSLARLLETDASALPDGALGRTLAELSRHDRPWIRALALRTRAEQNHGAREEAARLAAEDPHPIVRQAVPTANPAKPGDDAMETGQTLSIVERVLFLREVPIFRLLEPEDLEKIAEIARERLYPPGEHLCREGELGDELFVVVDGQVEVSRQVDGAPHILRTLEGGEHLGELAILRQRPRSASVRAARETRTLVLTGDALRTILEDRPEVSLAMLASLAERMSSLT